MLTTAAPYRSTIDGKSIGAVAPGALLAPVVVLVALLTLLAPLAGDARFCFTGAVEVVAASAVVARPA
jgi:hypothetical protein